MRFGNIFKPRYPELRGRDWIRRIDPEDRQAFVRLGMQAHEYGRLGGLKRGRVGKRDHKGRFTK